MWNPVTIVSLVGAVSAAAVAIITAIRTPHKAASIADAAISRHLAVSHDATTDDFNNRVNPN